MIFAAIIFASSLVSPVDVPKGVTWLEVLNVKGVGGRYFFVPHIAIFLALGWLCFTKTKVHIVARVIATLLLTLSFIIGVPKDFIHQPYQNFHYSEYMKKYRKLSHGQTIVIPNTPGLP